MRIVLIDKQSPCSAKQEPPLIRVIFSLLLINPKWKSSLQNFNCGGAARWSLRGASEGWCWGRVGSCTHPLSPCCCSAGFGGVGVPPSPAVLEAPSVGCWDHMETQNRCLIQQDTSAPSPSACWAPPDLPLQGLPFLSDSWGAGYHWHWVSCPSQTRFSNFHVKCWVEPGDLGCSCRAFPAPEAAWRRLFHWKTWSFSFPQLSPQTPLAVDPSTCLITLRAASSTCTLSLAGFFPYGQPGTISILWLGEPVGVQVGSWAGSAGCGAHPGGLLVFLSLFQNLCSTIPSIPSMPKWGSHGLHSSSSCWRSQNPQTPWEIMVWVSLLQLFAFQSVNNLPFLSLLIRQICTTEKLFLMLKENTKSEGGRCVSI